MSLMAGCRVYWSGSDSAHSPLYRLTALTSRKHFQSRWCLLLPVWHCCPTAPCGKFPTLPRGWAEQSGVSRHPQQQLKLLVHADKYCTTESGQDLSVTQWPSENKACFTQRSPLADVVCSISLLLFSWHCDKSQVLWCTIWFHCRWYPLHIQI